MQVFCYEDSKLLKLFSDIVRSLYDNDIIAEDTILRWYHKGSHPKGRQVTPPPSCPSFHKSPYNGLILCALQTDFSLFV